MGLDVKPKSVMIPLVDKPQLVVFPDFQTRGGETKIAVNSASNIAPNVEVIFAKNPEEFRRLSAGLQFTQIVTVCAAGD